MENDSNDRKTWQDRGPVEDWLPTPPIYRYKQESLTVDNGPMNSLRNFVDVPGSRGALTSSQVNFFFFFVSGFAEDLRPLEKQQRPDWGVMSPLRECVRRGSASIVRNVSYIFLEQLGGNLPFKTNPQGHLMAFSEMLFLLEGAYRGGGRGGGGRRGIQR